MDTSPVQLKIPDRWLFWRIYHVEGEEDEDREKPKVKDDGWDITLWLDCSGERYHRLIDLMDEKGFDEAASFPSIKPDRDLFGPPSRRYRKQRGWYHVKPWPAVTAAVLTTPQDYATGADIPQELIDNILNYCLDNRETSQNDVKALRLVCRRWEALSLSKMFERIVVRDHLAAPTFLKLLDLRKAHTRHHAEGWRPWVVDLPTRLLLILKGVTQTELTISGPLPAGRRLTSVYLSSPSRSIWSPLPIRWLYLENIHFRKLDDLARLLRELPYLDRVAGKNITWDRKEEYPRLASFIPCTDPHSSIQYTFRDCHLITVLTCVLSLSGSKPVAQSDADILYSLVSTLKVAPQSYTLSARFKSGLCINGVAPWPDVYVGFQPTQGDTQSVQSIAFDVHERPSSVNDPPVRMDQESWNGIFGFVETLARDTRPEILFIFPSTEGAASFLEKAAVLNVPALIASGRLKCVLESLQERTFRLVKSNGSGGWRVLATEKYEDWAADHNGCDFPGSRAHSLHELGSWAAVNPRD